MFISFPGTKGKSSEISEICCIDARDLGSILPSVQYLVKLPNPPSSQRKV